MIINIISIDKKYAKEYAKDLERHIAAQGKIVSYVKESHYKNRQIFNQVCENILSFNQAYLIVSNLDQPIVTETGTILPDINIIVLNENKVEQLTAASKITEDLEARYLKSDQPLNIELAHVYNRVGVPKRDNSTTEKMFRPVRKLKQTA